MQDDARKLNWPVPVLAAGYLITAVILIEIAHSFELGHTVTMGLVILFAAAVYGFSTWATRRIHASHRALEASEERYAAFVRNSSEGIWRIEIRRPFALDLPTEKKVDLMYEHGYYAEVNDAFLAMYGPGAEDIVESDLAESLPREENEDMLRYFFDNDMRVSGVVSKERTPDGRTLYFKSNCYGVVEDGKLVRIWGNQIDFTQQRHAERELELKSQLLSGAERIAETGSWTYQPDQQRFIFSDNLYTIHGLPDDHDLSLDSVLKGLHNDDRQRWRRNLQRVVDEGTSFTREIRVFRPDGQKLFMETRAEPVFDRQGQVIAVSGVSRDITRDKIADMARQDLELQVRQLQKMEAIGTLASGIAHDFNNILSATMGYADIALGELDPSHPAYDSIKEIEKANFRAKDLVDQILKHSRHLEQRRDPVSLAAVVSEALGLLKPSLPSRVHVVDELRAPDARVLGDASQLHQVVINLCTNACHAMPDGGTLRLRLDQIHSSEPLSPAIGRLPAGSYVHLTVSDTGEGIDEALHQRIFEPFFTTKEPGKGTGLGLSTVQGIVLDHQGGLSLHCPPTGGTTFEIFLPLCHQRAEEEHVARDSTPAGHRESILLIDDEIPLMALGEKMLNRLGYHAVALNSAHAALDLFDQDPDRFDLIVADLRMPEMSGLELAQEVRQRKPDARVLITTGFSEVELDQYLADGLIQGCLIKPFNLAAMGRSIADVLSREHDPRDESRPRIAPGHSDSDTVH